MNVVCIYALAYLKSSHEVCKGFEVIKASRYTLSVKVQKVVHLEIRESNLGIRKTQSFNPEIRRHVTSGSVNKSDEIFYEDPEYQLVFNKAKKKGCNSK